MYGETCEFLYKNIDFDVSVAYDAERTDAYLKITHEWVGTVMLLIVYQLVTTTTYWLIVLYIFFQ